MSKEVAILGVGMHPWGKWGRNFVEYGIKACRDAKVKLGCVFQSRTSPDMLRVREAIQGGALGKMTLGDGYFKDYRSAAYYKSAGWRGTWALDVCGALMNQGIHSVDLLTWLMGPVVEIQAHTAMLAHERIEVEDTAVATLRFANGALGVIEAATSVFPGYLKRIEIHGTGGSAVLEEEDFKAWDFAKPRKEDAAIHEQMQKHQSTGGGASDPWLIVQDGPHSDCAKANTVLCLDEAGADECEYARLRWGSDAFAGPTTQLILSEANGSGQPLTLHLRLRDPGSAAEWAGLLAPWLAEGLAEGLAAPTAFQQSDRLKGGRIA